MYLVEWKENEIVYKLKAETIKDLMWLLNQLTNRMITNESIYITKVSK